MKSEVIQRSESSDRDTDNRTLDEIVEYQEARIEALYRRVRELEAENARLREDWRETHAEVLEGMR